MDDISITWRGDRWEARRRIREIFSSDIRAAALLAGGVSLLSKILIAFDQKANLEADESGLRWQDLSPATKAYRRRFGSGEKAALKKAAGLGSPHRYGVGGKSGLLTKAQQDEWNSIYAKSLAWLAVKMPIGDAKSRAAAIAWARMKERGAKTKLEVYGQRKVLVLRDFGILRNSLTPGVEDPNQILEADRHVVVVGTRVPYAKFHHEGRGVPQRRLWPTVDRWPKSWWQAILTSMQSVFVNHFRNSA